MAGFTFMFWRIDIDACTKFMMLPDTYRRVDRRKNVLAKQIKNSSCHREIWVYNVAKIVFVLHSLDVVGKFMELSLQRVTWSELSKSSMAFLCIILICCSVIVSGITAKILLFIFLSVIYHCYRNYLSHYSYSWKLMAGVISTWQYPNASISIHK